MADVFVHVGLHKTGTTTIQAALEARTSALARTGVLIPGGGHRAQRLAAYDLLGQRVKGDDADVVGGAFPRLLEELTGFTGRTIVISEELLGLARPRHVRRLIRGFLGHRVFVVIGVRDMSRTLVSAWQQSVAMGSTTTWEDFIDAVRQPGRAPVADGTAFWLRHDPLRVIDTWRTEVPVARIRIVTVPPIGSSSSTLLERFAAAAELPTGIWAGAELTQRNVSLGAAEVEVVRRLNEHIVGRLTTGQYRHVVENGIRAGLELEGSRPLELPAEHFPWVREYALTQVAELQQRGCQVFGDLADLVPDEPPPSAVRLDEVSDAELLAASEAALASLALAHGRLFRRYRRSSGRKEGRPPNTWQLLGSTARAAAFGLQKAALKQADHSRALAWAARTYLRRTSGHD